MDDKTRLEIAELAALAAPQNAQPSIFSRRRLYGKPFEPAPQPAMQQASSSPLDVFARPGVLSESDTQPNEKTGIPALEFFGADELLSTPASPRRWRVEPWIPQAETTLFAGDGGTGKTTLALQLCVACAAGIDWLGLKVQSCRVLYVSAEDPKDEIHYRLEQITKDLQLPADALARLKIIDLAGKEAMIALFDSDGQIKPTALFSEIEHIASEHKIGLVIFDAVADFFGGNENERREVRSFIGALRGFAMRLDAAVVLVAHPSVDGIKTGRGYSGSTHWNNAVRSRLTFTSPQKTQENQDCGLDLRVLELSKSNRARRGEQIHVTWFDGRFIKIDPGTPADPAWETHAEEIFLQLLGKFEAEGQRVSNVKSSTYAPTQFAKRPKGKELGKDALERAMSRLLDKGLIRVETEGPPSRRRSHLALAKP
jgi:RecA-family ATPase